MAVGYARSKHWYCHDKFTLEGKYGMHQLIKVSTHILDTSCLCIDLMFKSQSNLIIELGVYLPLHLSCHHQIV